MHCPALRTTSEYIQLYHDKSMKLTEKHEFKTDENQKKTLKVLHDKYRINTSRFIREAISEKLEREKDSIFKNYSEIQKYLKELNNLPF